MSEKPEPSVRLFSYDDDQPTEGQGVLIPRKRTAVAVSPTSFSPAGLPNRALGKPVVRSLMVVTALLALVFVGSAGYGLLEKSTLVATPAITIVDPYTQNATALEYGPQITLAKHNFFVETREAFIDEEMSFVEADLTSKQLRYFDKGVLLLSTEILSVGVKGSWWETPSGLYQVEDVSERKFSNLSQAYFPWQVTFGGNFVIHGQPVLPDDAPVPADFSGGGIRISDADAKELFKLVEIDTPVLVHQATEEERDIFVYEPQVPELATLHYFIADIDNGTLLAASDLDVEVPIASLVKLMTAVVAAEELDLDGRVRVTQPTFVTSLIPRLSGRGSVSMYSLLQLLLVESSNEAAETIAGELGREEFIAAMNNKARQLGMLHTHFADPSGLSAENTSTLGDLYRLTRYIHQNRSFIFEITANAQVPSGYVGGEFDGLINFNEVEDLDSFVGGKVGETLAAGQTSISLHELPFSGEERTLVIILLGSEDRTGDITQLLAYVQEHFRQ